MVGYRTALTILILSLILVPAACAVEYNAAGTISTITDYPEERWEIEISGDNVIWVEPGAGYGEQVLYLHNTNDQKTRKIASSKYSTFHPGIGEDVVLWGEKTDSSGPVRLIRYDMTHANYTLVDPNLSNQDFPASEDGIIAWFDSRTGGYTNIYIIKGENSDSSLFHSSGTSDKHNPAISEGYVYWVEKGTLFRKNTESTTEEAVIGEIPNEYSISGQNIVWEFEGDYGKDIALLDTGAMLARTIVEEPGEQLNPAISQNNIVWQESLNDRNRICIKNLNTGIIAEIHSSDYVQSDPEISGEDIVWFDSTPGKEAVRMFELNCCAAPYADFTSDAKPSLPPLNVRFTPEITTPVNILPDLIWDFGDGTTSSETEPSHTYTAPGFYNVTLTISNIFGESVEFKQSHVIVGELPRPDFTADITMGDAPLTVRFRDASSGPYEDLIWDFGDGVGSKLKNPVHTYEQPGIYTVSLNLSNKYGSATEEKFAYVVVGLQSGEITEPAEEKGFMEIITFETTEKDEQGTSFPSIDILDLTGLQKSK